MASEAEYLVERFREAMPKIREAWLNSFQRGYQARLDGKPCTCRLRGGNKGMYIRGWEKADKTLRSKPGGGDANDICRRASNE